MNEQNPAELEEPTLIRAEAMVIAGLARTYTSASAAEIPGQWQEFGPLIENIPGRQGDVTYGVIYNGTDEGFDYLTGVEVAPSVVIQDGLSRLAMAAQTYAVFQHSGHVSEIRQTCDAIWSVWLPNSGRQAAESPWFERYPDAFDPRTGLGGLEVWIPIE